MLSSKVGTLGLLFAAVSLALCNPQRQGRGLGDIMENLWDGFSDHLDEFQVILTSNSRVVIFFNDEENYDLYFLLLLSIVQSWRRS